MQPILNASHGAHACVDFVDAGKRYTDGDPYPVAGLSQFKINGLIAAGRIAYGAASPRRLARAAARRALTEASKPAPSPAPQPQRNDQHRQQPGRR